MTYEVGSSIVARYIDHFREEFKMDFRMSKADVSQVLNQRIEYLQKIKTLEAAVEIAQITGFQKGLWEKSEIWSQIQKRVRPDTLLKGQYTRSYDKWEPEHIEFVRDRADMKDSILRDHLNRTYGSYHTLLAVRGMKRRLRPRS